MTKKDKEILRIAIAFLFLVSVGITMGACSISEENHEEHQKALIEDQAYRAVNNIYYVRDKRVDLCFACANYPGSRPFSMTEVPCDKVQHLLPDNQK